MSLTERLHHLDDVVLTAVRVAVNYLRTSEPALLRGAVASVLALAASVGLVLTDQQGEALTAAVLSLASVVQAFSTRRAVVPDNQLALDARLTSIREDG